MSDYQFRDEHYHLAWLEHGNWYILQVIGTLIVLKLYSPSSLKSSLSHAEVRTSRDQSNISGGQDMEEVDVEGKQEDGDQAAQSPEVPQEPPHKEAAPDRPARRAKKY